MFVLFTDFGQSGLYTGQMRAILHGKFPERPVLDACSDAPAFNPRASAYLLASLVPFYPADAIWLAVVDPGVGTKRDGLMLEADGRWFVGPDNGLLSQVMLRAGEASCWHIKWRPPGMPATFHGRDWFAHVALQLSMERMPEAAPVSPDDIVGGHWPMDLAEVIHVDHYGNLITGLRTETVPLDAVLQLGKTKIRRARTFGEVARGEAFWYANAMGLVEVAVNQGRAEEVLGARIGDPVVGVIANG
jgi:S-adenosyl-L-methionine hydrolase (adenosine-forming)